MNAPSHPRSWWSRLASARRFPWLAAGLLAAAAGAAYANSFAVPFLFDDVPSIVANPTIRDLGAPGSVLSPPQHDGITVGGRPLLNLSFALDYAWHELDPRGYHATNLALHLGAGLLLFGIVRRTLPTPRLRPRFGDDATRNTLALAVAALWLLHPLQTESVTYLVQRAESLAGLFGLLTLYCFMRGADEEPAVGAALRRDSRREKSGSGDQAPPTKRARRTWLTLAVVACWLGVTSKETVATAPLIALLYDRAFLAGSWRDAWRRRRGWHLALAASWLLLAALVIGAGGRGGTAGFGRGVSPWDYALTQCGAIIHYLRLVFWPDPLVFDYGPAVVSGYGEVWWAAAILGGLVVATVVALRRGRSWSFAAASFFVVLAPTSSVVPVATQTIAEHRMYLALAPVIVLFVLGLHALARRWSGVAFVALGAALAIATHARNRDYHGAVALWTDTAAKRPDNGRAQLNAGNALYELDRVAEALSYYQAALRLEPHSPEAHANLANALHRLERREEAFRHYEEALRLQPAFPDALENFGRALLAAGRTDDAIARFEAWVRLQPFVARAQLALGGARAARGDATGALEHLLAAIRLDPGDAAAHNDAGAVWRHLGRYDEARGHFETALRLRPDFDLARRNLAQLPPPSSP